MKIFHSFLYTIAFVKNWPFLFRFIIFGNIVQRNVFYDILQEKTAF